MAGTVAAQLPKQPLNEWYIRMKTAAGDSVVKKMMTAQMIKMVEEGTLNPSAQISRDPTDGFRALATYKEFQSVALGKVSKKATHEMAFIETSVALPMLYAYALQKNSARGRKRLSYGWRAWPAAQGPVSGSGVPKALSRRAPAEPGRG